jgi:hypothetical protein
LNPSDDKMAPGGGGVENVVQGLSLVITVPTIPTIATIATMQDYCTYGTVDARGPVGVQFLQIINKTNGYYTGREGSAHYFLQIFYCQHDLQIVSKT